MSAEPVQTLETEFLSEDYSDSDSGAQSSSTTSLTSSIHEYQYENGRRYHSFRDGKYILPNDEREQQRLDIYHHIFAIMLGGKTHLAPIKKPKRILDVGTGTGSWAIDIAEEFPDAEIIGNDLSPIQPVWVPPNVRFEVDDAEAPWTHPKDYFDLIHLRTLSGSFQDWDAVIAQVYDHLKPGAYVEFHDYTAELLHNDGTHREHAPFAKWWDLVTQTSELAGRPFKIAKHMEKKLIAAGFEDVTASTHIWTIGPWAKDKKLKEIGKWGLQGMIDGLSAFSLALLTRVSGWKAAEVEKLCYDAKRELLSKENKYYTTAVFIHGRKPLAKK
ncbi:S-adenosyl-L-methionine-dependent methyltransferase [Peziza echinospora]|nr:S-adenosyl-L-methionine-dependent methyltransferase [Peziza echinospora]